jgi:hypothetical protein
MLVTKPKTNVVVVGNLKGGDVFRRFFCEVGILMKQKIRDLFYRVWNWREIRRTRIWNETVSSLIERRLEKTLVGESPVQITAAHAAGWKVIDDNTFKGLREDFVDLRLNEDELKIVIIKEKK